LGGGNLYLEGGKKRKIEGITLHRDGWGAEDRAQCLHAVLERGESNIEKQAEPTGGSIRDRCTEMGKFRKKGGNERQPIKNREKRNKPAVLGGGPHCELVTSRQKYHKSVTFIFDGRGGPG